jgi:hypothetical protein
MRGPFCRPHLTGRGVTLMNFFTIGGCRHHAVRDRRGGVSSSGPAVDPGGPYAALFGFYFVLLAAALAIYLFSRDARPERR